MTKKDMRLKENWSKDRMVNLLYRNGKCRYCEQSKGKPHKLLDINEIPPDKRSDFSTVREKVANFGMAGMSYWVISR